MISNSELSRDEEREDREEYDDLEWDRPRDRDRVRLRDRVERERDLLRVRDLLRERDEYRPELKQNLGNIIQILFKLRFYFNFQCSLQNILTLILFKTKK